MGSLLIRSGKIVDGAGSPGFIGHILVQDDRIQDVIREGGKIPVADAVIDAAGCIISPGFIDMHSHADWLLPVEDHPGVMRPFLEQGITTLVAGNCGISPAPIRPETVDLLKVLASISIDQTFDFNWRSMAEFLDRVEGNRPVVNLVQLAGHAAIRYAFSDTRRGEMAPAELQKCLDQARRSLSEGAAGLSFGLGYDPGMYSSLQELSAFCSVAAKAGKPVTVHLKALSRISPCYPVTTFKSHNILALKEMLEIARETGVKLQLSHFIFVGRNTWSTARECLDMVEQARQQGTDVMIDAFPYTCGNTTIFAPIPYWFLAAIPAAYNNKWLRTRLRAELEIGFRLVGFIYKDFQIMDAAIPGMEDLAGMRVDEVARKWGVSPFNAMLKLCEQSKGSTLMLFHTYSGEPGNEAVIESVLSNPLCLFETDVALKSKGYPNPAALGTFPKILGEYVRDKKLFSLEDAVKRMTLASAERFGIKDRGIIAPGKAADIVVFDPQKIADTPPQGSQPAGKPKGIKHVFINGVQAVRDGSFIHNARAGRVVRV